MRLTGMHGKSFLCSGCCIALILSIIFLHCLRDHALAAPQDEKMQAKLINAAKKEGKLVWYTSMSGDRGEAIRKRFQEKYPFIDTSMYRTGDQNLVTKIFAEAQAKKNVFDVVAITGILGETIKKKGLLAKYDSPERKFYPEGLKEPEAYWTDYFLNLTVIGYNTKLVSAKECPKTYEDLLAPRWKGKMVMDDKAFYWFANILKIMGEKHGLEYMRRLSDQNVQFRTGRTLIAQLIAAGESPLGITLYNNRVEQMKAEGAPIEWLAIEPVVPEIHPVGMSAHPPHPNAARLFIDFILSRECQELLASFFYIPSRIDVDPIVPRMKKGMNILPFDFTIGDEYPRYAKLYREVLMKK